MSDLDAFLEKIRNNLKLLQDRRTKYSGEPPASLLTQISDHEKALGLTEQALANDISEADWRTAIEPLVLDIEARGGEASSSVTIGDITGGIHDSVIVGRDLVLQVIKQASLTLPERNLAGQLALLEQALPQLDPLNKITAQAAIEKLRQALAALPGHEQRYRQRLKARYAEDAPYYIPLSGETTEVTPSQSPAAASRSARRRQQRALAEYCEWIQVGQEIKRVKLDTLRQGVDKYPCIILLGDPGSGKTTALEHLAYELADEANRLPLPLRLSQFQAGLTVEEFIEQGWAGAEQAGLWGMPELAANLDGYLAEGKLFVMFDALNEMPHAGYQKRAQALHRFIDTWFPKGSRFLVTCRVLDYGEKLSGLQWIEIQPLTDEQIKSFVRNELPETWESLWHRLPERDDQPRRLLELARNPYLLTMMIDIFSEDGDLGGNRAALLDRFTRILMGWAKHKPHLVPIWLDEAVQAEALSVIAFEMQARASSGAAVKTRHVKKFIPASVQTDPAYPPDPIPDSDDLLILAAGSNLIKMQVNRSTVHFYHQLLQEYFAARHMLKQQPDQLVDFWRWPGWSAKCRLSADRVIGTHSHPHRRPDGKRLPSWLPDWLGKMTNSWCRP